MVLILLLLFFAVWAFFFLPYAKKYQSGLNGKILSVVDGY